jgi:hypothetical protein
MGQRTQVASAALAPTRALSLIRRVAGPLWLRVGFVAVLKVPAGALARHAKSRSSRSMSTGLGISCRSMGSPIGFATFERRAAAS